MAAARAYKRSQFVWQGVLILLPVAVLAAVGFFSLRQDRILAELDAKERAQALADELAPKIWTEINPLARAAPPSQDSESGTNAGQTAVTIQISQARELLYPPPLTPTPIPQPLEVTSLNDDQARLWDKARALEFGGAATSIAVEAYQQFVASDPPERFAAAASFALGLLLQKQPAATVAEGQARVWDAVSGQLPHPPPSPEAAAWFARVVHQYPNSISESGVPLGPLAEIKGLEVAALTTNLTIAEKFMAPAVVCSNAVFHPSALTPYLLKRAAELEELIGSGNSVPRWQRAWEAHELARKLYATVAAQLARRGHAVATMTGVLSDSQFQSLVQTLERRPTTTANARSLDAAWPAIPSEQSDLGVPRYFWFNAPDVKLSLKTNVVAAGALALPLVDINLFEGSWLAGIATNDAVSLGLVCRPETEVRRGVAEFLQKAEHVPDYFGVAVELAGKIVAPSEGLRVWRETYHGGKTGGLQREFVNAPTSVAALLATSTRAAGAGEWFKVNVHLTSPTTLFARQRARTFWFGLLIAASAVVAMIGLLTAWRAFQRQQQLGELKSNFVSSVSHELRAPIASVRLLAEGLDSGRVKEEPKRAEYFRFIVQECRRLSSLIENVLDFSRIEQGRKQYEFEPTDLVALIQQTVKLMEPYAAERQITLAVKLDELQLATSRLPIGGQVHPQPSVDGRALQQALVNLIDNALKHSPKGSTVTIGLEFAPGEPGHLADAKVHWLTGELSPRIAPPPAHLQLWVEDAGEGIPPEDHERIFERFYRRGSELRRETQGVGLGLAIVKHVVEAHGGKVVVRSAVGQGSRFTLELPMCPQVDGK